MPVTGPQFDVVKRLSIFWFHDHYDMATKVVANQQNKLASAKEQSPILPGTEPQGNLTRLSFL